MLTVKQAADFLGLSRSSVYELISRQKLPAFRVGPRRGAIRIREEDLKAYLTNCQEKLVDGRIRERRVRLRHIHA